MPIDNNNSSKIILLNHNIVLWKFTPF